MLNPISKGVVAGLAALAFTADAVVLPTTPAQGFCGPPLGCGPNGGPGGPRPGFVGGHPRFGGGVYVPPGGGGGDDAGVIGGLITGAIIGGALAAHPYGYGGYGYGYVPHYYGHKPHYGVTRLSQSSKKPATTCTTARERKVTSTEPNNTQATANQAGQLVPKETIEIRGHTNGRTNPFDYFDYTTTVPGTVNEQITSKTGVVYHNTYTTSGDESRSIYDHAWGKFDSGYTIDICYTSVNAPGESEQLNSQVVQTQTQPQNQTPSQTSPQGQQTPNQEGQLQFYCLGGDPSRNQCNSPVVQTPTQPQTQTPSQSGAQGTQSTASNTGTDPDSASACQPKGGGNADYAIRLVKDLKQACGATANWTYITKDNAVCLANIKTIDKSVADATISRLVESVQDYGALQCVGFVRAVSQDLLPGGPQSAKDYGPEPNYTFVNYDGTNAPEIGDFMVWKNSGDGHIAVVTGLEPACPPYRKVDVVEANGYLKGMLSGAVGFDQYDLMPAGVADQYGLQLKGWLHAIPAASM